MLVIAPAALVSTLRSCLEQSGSTFSRSVRVLAANEPIAGIVARAHRARPPYGVAVVAREEDVDALLALGVDEVLIAPFDGSALATSIRRAALRAGVREHGEVEARTLENVLSGITDSAEGSLTALALDIDALRYTAEDLVGDDRVALDDCARAVERVSQTIRDARAFAPCDGEWNPEPIVLAPLIDQVVRVLCATSSERAHVERDDEDRLPTVFAPRRPLARILSRLLLHALDEVEQSEPTRGLRRIRIAARNDRGAVAVVMETSPGLDSLARSRLRNESMFAVARETLRTFHGELVTDRSEDGRLRLAVFLPRLRVEFPAMRLRDEGSALGQPSRRHRVLLVVPDERILRAAARALDDRFDVLLATTGEEAIATLDENRIIDLLVIDARLPDMSAALLVEELRRRRHDLTSRIVFLAGEGQSTKGLPVSGEVRVLEKPVRRASLVATLESLLATPSSVLAVPTRELN